MEKAKKYKWHILAGGLVLLLIIILVATSGKKTPEPGPGPEPTPPVPPPFVSNPYEVVAGSELNEESKIGGMLRISPAKLAAFRN